MAAPVYSGGVGFGMPPLPPFNSTAEILPTGPERMQGVTVCLPIVYGSIAYFLGKKNANETCTHRWALYVRSPHGHDLTTVLSNVKFTLHQSFAQPIRDVRTHPFEVTEMGWGEFEAIIDIFFHDQTEKSVELRHLIRLFPFSDKPPTSSTKKPPVLHEYYDEVVFTDPTVEFYQKLMTLPETKARPTVAEQDYPMYADVEDLQKLHAAHEFVQQELRGTKNQLLRLEAEMKDYASKKKTFPSKKSENSAAARS